MRNNKTIFICIGAVHTDYILQLQKNYFKKRTNPINQKEFLGGVAYNIALKLSFLLLFLSNPISPVFTP